MTYHIYIYSSFQMVFLVGGFSLNDWLLSQLKSYFEAKNIVISLLDDNVYVLNSILSDILTPLQRQGGC